MRPQEIVRIIEANKSRFRNNPPSGVLLELAEEHNMAPEQLRKMAQIFNCEAATAYLDKASGEARGKGVKPLDPGELVSTYEKNMPSHMQGMGKRASAVIVVNPYKVVKSFDSMPDLAKLDRDDVMAKEASAALAVTAAPTITKVEGRNITKSSALALREASRALASHEEDMRRDVIKFASAVRINALSFPDLEEDVELNYGDSGIIVINKLATMMKSCGVDPTRLSKDKERTNFVADRTGYLDHFNVFSKRFSDSIFLKAAFSQLKDEMDQQVEKVATATGVAVPKKTGDWRDLVARKFDSEKERREAWQSQMDDPGPVSTMGEGGFFNAAKGDEAASKGIRDAVGTGSLIPESISKLTQSPRDFADTMINQMVRLNSPGYGFEQGVNPNQEKIDQGIDQVQEFANIQHIVRSDPVLREADPQMLEEMINTLKEADPSITGNKLRLSYLLRELVQYNGVPPHMLNELQKTRETQLKNRSLGAEADKAQYSGVRLKTGPGKKEDK